MERQRELMVGADRLSDLPDSILLHILSMLPNNKEVVRTSVLSERWQFLWKFVPTSLNFNFPISDNENVTRDYLVSIHRELYYWRSCEKIRKLRVWGLKYEERYAKDVDIWVHFATRLANIEDLELGLLTNNRRYEFPQFAYKTASLRNLVLWNCRLNPFGNVNWSSLVSLSIVYMGFTDGVVEKVLSGCPNVEYLELENFLGIHRLEIRSMKLRELIIRDYKNENHDLWLELLAPYIQKLQILGLCSEICIINVASLVTAVLCFDFDFEDEEQNLEREFRFFKELLHSVAHVENLNLGSWCIECLSILELTGWEFPPSSRKFLELGVEFEQLDFPGICCFLQSTLDLETLVIDWYDVESGDLLSRYINEDEQIRRFESHSFNGSFPYLKTIKILNFYGFVLPLVKYLLKHAIVLEKFDIVVVYQGSDVSTHYATQWHKSSQAIQDPLRMLQLTFLIDDFGPLPFVNIATYLTSITLCLKLSGLSCQKKLGLHLSISKEVLVVLHV
ncbi:F-box/LRR-repeat protein At3g03360-like [Solanum stenotomum]|uniref:F-box/LRR-repeat protein At3g03360-like n=1 Tax=Solanum stenotomum TaxID=172797 RepID=UPI0020D11A08|nr:F-box/LRR-repeat protein At3g03360-like [Solanum stenotomum]